MAARVHSESARRVSGCVTALLREQPFFGSLALRLPIRADSSRETVASDGREIRYSPRWIAEAQAHVIETAMARIVLACALKHHTRRGQRDAERWQRASQLVTHGLLRDAGFTLPPDAEAWDGISVEQAYDRLPEPDPDDGDRDNDAPSGGGAAGADSAGTPPSPDSGGDDDSGVSDDGARDDDPQDGDSQETGADAPPSCDPAGTGEVMDAPADSGQGGAGPSPSEVAAEEQAWDEAMHQAASLAKAQGKLPGAVEETVRGAHATRDYWRAIMDRLLGGRPLKRAIVTHFHPDHLGLAGWFHTEFDVPLWMTYTEWLQAHCAWGRSITHDLDAWVEFCVTNGLDEGSVDEYRSSRSSFGRMVTPIPLTVRRIWDGERFEINGHEWRVITGSGHSAEHAALYCADLNVLISGDQVLPRITTNISLWYTEPDGDPLRQFLESFDKFRALPADALVLPSHNLPFHGLHDRLDYLVTHHRERLDAARDFCSRPRTGIDVISVLFDCKIDIFQIGLALGEALAHLNYLVGDGSLRKYRSSASGKIVYERVAESDPAS